MSDVSERVFLHLPPMAAQIGRAVAKPRRVAAALVVALTTLGWLYLALTAGDRSLLATLCRPLGNASGLAAFGVASSLWMAMTLAMMLPTAAPMILTYAEIAETAAERRQHAVSPLVLTAGYTAVWLTFALVLALLSSMMPDLTASRAGLLVSAALFAGAGLYQFSALKHACLHKCRAPFQFFFTNWKTTRAGVFKLGMRQGLYCLGCCWAMMALMLATGAMNVAWMATLAVAMTIEKMARGHAVSRAFGVILFAIAAIFAIAAADAIAI